MFKNPLYSSLKKDQKLQAKNSKKTDEFYFFIPLDLMEPLSLDFRGKTYSLEEHHLSIYEEFTNRTHLLPGKKKTHSPIHITSTYRGGTDTIIIHTYFDVFGNYLNSQISRKDVAIPLVPEEESAVKKLIEENKTANLKLKSIFHKLQADQNEAKTKQDLAISSLEEESKKSTATAAYRQLLRDSIKACDEHNHLEFYPRHAVSRFLQKQLRYLETIHPVDKKILSVPNKPPKIKPVESNALYEDVVTLSALNLESESLAEEKSTPGERVSDGSVAAAEAALYQQLDDCEPNDLNNMLKITRELDELAKSHQVTLIQACIDGNLKALEHHLNGRDVPFIRTLLSTCVYHNKPDLFAWLYKQNKGDFFLFSPPYVTAVTYPPYIPFSFLEIAYRANHQDFFVVLLNEYHEPPNPVTLEDTPLLIVIVEEQGNINWIRAMLAAGAKPDLAISGKMGFCWTHSGEGDFHKEAQTLLAAFSSQPETKLQLRTYTKDAKRIHRFEVENDETRNFTGVTALHLAAKIQYLDAINLLLSHGANSALRDKHNFTPFGYAIISSKVGGYSPNKFVLDAFLKKGHFIDERNGISSATGLYYACQNNRLDDVKLLLAFKANPCALHDTPMSFHGKTSIMTMTPLSLSANRALIPLLSELLKCVLPSREIMRAIIVAHTDCADILRTAYLLSSNREGIEAFKAGNLESAESLYQSSLKRTVHDEERHSIYYNLSVCLLKAGKQAEAVKAILQCIAIREGLFPKNDPSLLKAREKYKEININLAESVRMHS